MFNAASNVHIFVRLKPTFLLGNDRGFVLLRQTRQYHPQPIVFLNRSALDASQTHKARQANAKIAQQLQERLEENRRVSSQLVQLATSVKVREAIYRSHMEASGGEINPAQQVKYGTLNHPCFRQNVK